MLVGLRTNMRNRILCSFGISLLVAALGTGCRSKPTTPAAEAQPDGVSSVPPPAERDPDLAATDLPLAGAVKEIKFKVLDKDADDKTKGLLRIKVFSQEGSIDLADNSRYEVWKPGSDPEEQKAELNAPASSEQAVAPGAWDIRILYDEGPVCKANGWIRNVTIEAGKLRKGEAAVAAPMQYVRLAGALGGDDLGSNARVEVFKAGTDQAEFQPIVSFWTTQKQALASGSYDFRLTYEKDKIKAKGGLKAFAVGSDHGVQRKTVALAKSK
jgi:hypothetical protein